VTRLNYHHLYYFWRVATVGKLNDAAAGLRVSQSALSLQIKQLEENLGSPLFSRTGRKLVLTDFGTRILAYAQDIFARGEELELRLQRGFEEELQHLSIGVLANLSRNFVEGFIAPLLSNPHASFTLTTRNLPQLLNGLVTHELDLVLANTAVLNDSAQALWQNHLVGRQVIAIVGPSKLRPPTSFPKGYEGARWVLPAKTTEIRSAFDALCARWQYRPNVQAEVDDMAMLRLLARDSGSFAVLPPVVVKDEIKQNLLAEYQILPNSFESFFAITIEKKIVPNLLQDLLKSNSFAV
jgi:LysR family transcriptional activator of nhaA